MFKFIKKINKVYDELFYYKSAWFSLLGESPKEHSAIEDLREDIKSLEEEIDKLHEYLGVNRQKNCTDKLVKKTKNKK